MPNPITRKQFDDAERLLRDKKFRKEPTLKDIAQRTGLSAATLRNIWHGRLRRPPECGGMLTTRDVAEVFNVSERQVRRWRRAGKISAAVTGAVMRYSRESVEDYKRRGRFGRRSRP